MNFCREPPSKQLLPVLPQEDCLSSVELNSLQASEETTTSSLTVKPSEPQASCCLCYKPPGRLAWPGTGLEPQGSHFPTAFVTCPEFKNKYGAGVIVGSEIHWRFKRGGVIIHSWVCYLYSQVHFPSLLSVSALLKWERQPLKCLWEWSCSASMWTVRLVFWFLPNHITPGSTSLRPKLPSQMGVLTAGIWSVDGNWEKHCASVLGTDPGCGGCSAGGNQCSCFCNLSSSSDSPRGKFPKLALPHTLSSCQRPLNHLQVAKFKGN